MHKTMVKKKQSERIQRISFQPEMLTFKLPSFTANFIYTVNKNDIYTLMS